MIAFPSKLVVLALAATAVPVASNSFSFNDPSYGNGAVWDVQGLSGIPDTNYLGGIKFTDDGKFVCIVEDAEQGADIYCFDVVRDPNSGAVTDIAQLDPANNVPITLEDLSLSGGDFRQLDVGFTPGPGGM